MERLPRPLQKLVALLLALLVLAILGGVLLVPYLTAKRLETQTRQIEQTISQMQEQILERENVLAEQRMLERSLDNNANIMAAATAGLAGAELQRWLREFIETAGGTVDAAQILDPQPNGPFQEIAVRTEFNSTIEELRAILYQIETHVPVIIIKGLSIQRIDDPFGTGLAQRISGGLAVSAFLNPAEE